MEWSEMDNDPFVGRLQPVLSFLNGRQFRAFDMAELGAAEASSDGSSTEGCVAFHGGL